MPRTDGFVDVTKSNKTGSVVGKCILFFDMPDYTTNCRPVVGVENTAYCLVVNRAFIISLSGYIYYVAELCIVIICLPFIKQNMRADLIFKFYSQLPGSEPTSAKFPTHYVMPIIPINFLINKMRIIVK